MYEARRAVEAPEEPARQVTRSISVPTPALVASIRAIVESQLAWGHRKVRATLRLAKHGVEGLKVSRRRVYEVMRAHGWTLPSSPRVLTTTRGHVTVPEPDRRIAADLTTVWTRMDGTVAVVLTVDCGCRSVLDVAVTRSQGSPAVLWPVERGLFEAFGDPSNVVDGVELRTDHGPQFDTVEDVQRALDLWRATFNHERPPQALGWKTPSEVRAEKLGPDRAAA